MDGHRTKFQLDTGATCNVLRKSDLGTAVNLKETNRILSLYDGTKIKHLGKCQMTERNPMNGKRYVTQFVVVDKAPTAILGATTVQQMQLLKLQRENIQSVTIKQEKRPQTATRKTIGLSKENIIDKYPEVFQGEMGRLEGKLTLEIDSTVQPVRLPVRRIPLAVKAELKKELDRLEKLNVIQREDKPTDWISSLVVVRKQNGKLRICIDPKPLNNALKRSHYLLPTLEDLLPELTEAKVFSVLDVRNRFWHIELDKE